jgi:hypothetical protein
VRQFVEAEPLGPQPLRGLSGRVEIFRLKGFRHARRASSSAPGRGSPRCRAVPVNSWPWKASLRARSTVMRALVGGSLKRGSARPGLASGVSDHQNRASNSSGDKADMNVLLRLQYLGSIQSPER